MFGFGFSLGRSIASFPKAVANSLRVIYETLNGGAPIYQHGDETYLTEAQGRFQDTSGYVLQTVNGGITIADGWVNFSPAGGQQKVRHDLLTTIPVNTRVRVSWRQVGVGGVRVSIGSNAASVYQAVPGYWYADVVVSTNRTWFEIQQQGGTGEVSVTDVTIRTLDPATSDYDIIILGGQSNMVGASSGSIPDPAYDFPHPLIDLMAGNTNSGTLTVDGEVTGAIPPLQHRSANFGVGPGMAFARWYAENKLAPGRRVLIVAVADGGTALLNGTPQNAQDGADANWHPLNTLPADRDLYTRAINSVNSAKALGGNNQVVAFLWSQGESDRGLTSAPAYREAFATELAPKFRTAISEPTMPIVILGLNPAVDTPNTDDMRAEQAKLDKDSGHIDAVPNCVYVPWNTAEWGDGTKPIPEDDLDRVHFGSDANRVRGVSAALEYNARLV